MTHEIRGRVCAAFLLTTGIAVAVSGQSDTSGAYTQLPPMACAALPDLAIAGSAIGLPTGGGVVQTAVLVAAGEPGNINGDFCKVVGIIKPTNPGSPSMEFEVNLPLVWNRRVLQMGGGGYNGTLVTGLTPYTLQPPNTDTPLKQGFATVGSDGGHKGGPGFDGTFGLDNEALLNYGKESVKKTHDAAMAVIQYAYRRAPERFYFIGGSQGGHEALDAAARYPDDYDGVVAHYPAYNVTLLHLASLNFAKAIYAGGGKAWMNPTEVKLVTDAVYATCDGLDGAKDGIISHVSACNKTFNVKKLRCADGADTGDTCLSDAQLRAIATITSEYKPGFDIAGMDTFPRWPLLEGALFQGRSNFGSVPQPSNPLSGKEALLYSAGDQTVKFIITRNPKIDPMTFDPKQHKERVELIGRILDVTNVSLEKFRAKGGKIIMTHGTADDFISPHNSIAYYERQGQRFRQSNLDNFMRFYLIPGLGHGFGPFNAKFDSLGVLRKWVEQGEPPTGLIATDANEGPNAGRTRPLCEYPKWPKFTGPLGSEHHAGSFTCTE